MGGRTVLAGVVTGCAMGLAAAGPAHAETVPCSGADTTLTNANRATAVQTVACLVDRERASRGLPRLAVDDRVARSAQAYADDMLAGGYVGHDGPEDRPSTSTQRLAAQGYTAAYDGETIGQGQTSPRMIVRQWLNSPNHCPILLAAAGPQEPSTGPVHLGVGSAGLGSKALWVMQVARPAGTPDPGYPGFTPSCPVAQTAPDDAEVQPFVRHEQQPVDGTQPPPGGGGTPTPPTASPLTVPAPPADAGVLRSGRSVSLTMEAAPGAVLQVSVTDAQGRTRVLGTATAVNGVPASRPGLVLYALPRITVVTAVTVTVTDGVSTVTRRIVPVAILSRTRATRTTRGRVRVTGRLRPGLAGRRIRVTLIRGKRTRTVITRTRGAGTFSTAVRLPRGRARTIAVRVTAIADPALYGEFVMRPRAVRLGG